MSTGTKPVAQLTVAEIDRINSTSDQWIDEMRLDQAQRQFWLKSNKIDFAAQNLSLRGGLILHEYQNEGVQWLLDQYALGNGCLLGDEMGLGKTLICLVYMISLIRHWEATPALYKHNEFSRPCFLVVAPLSVVPNWQDHVTKHCPEDIVFIRHVGSQKDRDESQDLILKYRKHKSDEWRALPAQNTDTNQSPIKTNVVLRSHPCVDIIVTSYEVLLMDIDFFSQFHFTNIILDEAHRVKSSQTSLYTVLKRVPSPFHDPARHVTHSIRHNLRDTIHVNSTFLQQILQPITPSIVLGNGSAKTGGAALHTSQKKYDGLKKYNEFVLSFDNAVLLTGTPVQNNIAEMWTLLNIAYPAMFPINSQLLYNKCFDNLITGHNFTLPTDPPPQVQHALRNLQAVLDIVMLRRIKAGVDIKLPPKASYVLYSGLTSLQLSLYRATLGKNQQALMDCIGAYGPQKTTDEYGNPIDPTKNKQKTVTKYGGKKLSAAELNKSVRALNTIWVSLRKIVNHSYLIPGAEPQPSVLGEHLVLASAKLLLLDEILSRVISRGHRVLIFSTSTQTLDILQDYCELRNYNASRLDGSVRGSDRGELISEFQKQKSTTTTATTPRNSKNNEKRDEQTKKRSFTQLGQTQTTKSYVPDTPIFLLSTRAAGVGITLTAADTVIFYDNDFNQAADAQAEQRCYRIGQDKPVMSIRLICKGSIEHLYYLRSVRKAALADAVMKEGKFSSNPSVSQGDNDYVRVVVPDSVLQPTTTEADDDSTTTAAPNSTGVKSRGIEDSSSAANAGNVKDSATDSGTLQFAVQLLKDNAHHIDEDNDDDDSVAAKTARAAKEKKRALLYDDEDLEWITTQGYSPNWGKVGEDDDGAIDRRNNVLKKQRYLGGLTDFMTAAEVQRDEVKKAQDILGDDPIAKKYNKNQPQSVLVDPNAKVFDTTNVPTMRLVHFQDIMADNQQDKARRKKRGTHPNNDINDDADDGHMDDVMNKKRLEKMKLELSSAADLQSFLHTLSTKQPNDDNDEFSVPTKPRKRTSVAKKTAMNNDDSDDDVKLRAKGQSTRNSIPTTASKLRTAQKNNDKDDVCTSTLSSLSATMSTLLHKLPTQYNQLRDDLHNVHLICGKKLSSFAKNGFIANSMILTSNIHTVCEYLRDYFRGEMIQDGAFYDQLQQHFLEQVQSAQAELYDNDVKSRTDIDHNELDTFYSHLQSVTFSQEGFKKFLEYLQIQPMGLNGDTADQVDTLNLMGQEFEATLANSNLSPENRSAVEEQYAIIKHQYSKIYSILYKQYNTRLYLYQNYNMSPTGPANGTAYTIARDNINAYRSLQLMFKSVRSSMAGDVAIMAIRRFMSIILPSKYNDFTGTFFDLEGLGDEVGTSVAEITLHREKFSEIYYAILLNVLDNLFDEVFNMLVTGSDESNSCYHINPVSELLQELSLQQHQLNLKFRQKHNENDDFMIVDDEYDSKNYSVLKLNRVPHVAKFVYSILHVSNTSFHTAYHNLPQSLIPESLKINKKNQLTPITQFINTVVIRSHDQATANPRSVDGGQVLEMKQSLRYGLLYIRNNLVPPLQYHTLHAQNSPDVASPANNSAFSANATTSSGPEDFFIDMTLDEDQDAQYCTETDPLINVPAQLHHISGNMLKPELTIGLPTSAMFPDQLAVAFDKVHIQPAFPPNDNRAAYITSLPRAEIPTPGAFPMARSQGYILLNFSDNSGQFGRGFFLGALKNMSSKLVQIYEQAEQEKQLALGNVCIGAINHCCNNYIANLIVMDQEDRSKIDLGDVQSAMKKVFHFAKLNNLIVIGPKQGYSPDRQEYSNYEHAMQEYAQVFDVDSYIVYFSRQERVKANTSAPARHNLFSNGFSQ